MAELKITKNNFNNEIINSDIPVLLDFWASWCGPCRMLSPIIGELAKEYDGKLKIGKVNVDEEPELASHFNIASIPTVVIIKDKTIMDKSIGFVPKNKLEEMIKTVL